MIKHARVKPQNIEFIEYDGSQHVRKEIISWCRNKGTQAFMNSDNNKLLISTKKQGMRSLPKGHFIISDMWCNVLCVSPEQFKVMFESGFVREPQILDNDEPMMGMSY